MVLKDSVIAPSDDNEDENAEVQVGNLEPIKPKVEVQDFLNSYRMQQKDKFVVVKFITSTTRF